MVVGVIKNGKNDEMIWRKNYEKNDSMWYNDLNGHLNQVDSCGVRLNKTSSFANENRSNFKQG